MSLKAVGSKQGLLYLRFGLTYARFYNGLHVGWQWFTREEVSVCPLSAFLEASVECLGVLLCQMVFEEVLLKALQLRRAQWLICTVPVFAFDGDRVVH